MASSVLPSPRTEEPETEFFSVSSRRQWRLPSSGQEVRAEVVPLGFIP